MFNLQVKISNPSTHKEKTSKHLEHILKEIISKEPPFEDPADFLLWAEESLPFIHWQKQASSEDPLSVYLLCWASHEPDADFFFTTLKKKLTLRGYSFKMSLQHFDFNLREMFHKKFSIAEVQIHPETSLDTQRLWNVLPELLEELLLEIKFTLHKLPSTLQTKPCLIQNKIVRFKNRFSSGLNDQIFEETRGFLAVADPKFIEQRSDRLLTRLIISQYFSRKALLKALGGTTHARHVFYRLLPSCLSSPFTSKKVWGIFIGLNLLHKYEVFNEEHVLRALQKMGLEVLCVPGGSYSFQRHGEPFKFLYVEIEKKDETPVSLKEYQQLRTQLNNVLKGSVERLQPSVFMVNNEEEIVKNILLLSREIGSLSDLAQVMIHLEEQTDKDVCFQLILVYPQKNDLLMALKKSFHRSETVYLPHWTHTVRHLRKKHPIHAHVFKLRIPKTNHLLRSDGSLNFYAARQKISDLLTQAIGDFRDYNGGIIIKQGEILAQFKELFKNHSAELQEDFFYGLTPLETQATIPLTDLSTLFDLFLEGKKVNLQSPSDCFFKSLRKGKQTFCIVQAKDVCFASDIKTALETLKIDQKNLVSTQLMVDERASLGCIFEHDSELKHKQFVDALQTFINAWQTKVSNTKTLRLAISSGLRPLDPRIQSDEDSKLILKLLFEGLMRIDARGKVEPGVAQKVKISSDRKKYIFKLRRTYWSNGMQVVADDFVYSWKTLLSPEFKAPPAYLFYPIKNAQSVKEGRLSLDSLGVKALSKDLLEIELEYPAPYFLELLAQPPFCPINPFIDRSQPNWPHLESHNYVCNGAFLLNKNHPSQGYELVKNPSYHSQSQIHLDKIMIKNAPLGGIRELFLQNQIDWLGFPTGMVDINALPLERGDILVLPNESLYWYVFNTACFPFNHLKLRQALAYVVNRARILQEIPPGHWPAFSVLPIQYSQGPLMEESRQKGIRLFEDALDELGLDRQTFPNIKLLSAEGTIRDSVAKIIKREWEEAFGIECQVEAYGWNEIFHRLKEGNFQICGVNWINLINDPNYTLQIFRNTSMFINFPHWNHPEYEGLLDQINGEKKASDRLHYFALAEEILLREVPVIPLFRSMPSSIKKSHIEISSHSSLKSWDFKWASIRTH